MSMLNNRNKLLDDSDISIDIRASSFHHLQHLLAIERETRAIERETRAHGLQLDSIEARDVAFSLAQYIDDRERTPNEFRFNPQRCGRFNPIIHRSSLRAGMLLAGAEISHSARKSRAALIIGYVKEPQPLRFRE